MMEFVWDFTLGAGVLYVILCIAEKLLKKYKDKKAVNQRDSGASVADSDSVATDK